MKNFIIGIFAMFISFVSAQESQNVFKEANNYYRAEDYTKAIKSYKAILEQGLESSEVYFNLGNAYYKTNKMAEAIYSFEKALVLNPSNQDAKTNLAYANRSIIDSIKTIPKSTLDKFNDNVLALLSYNTWAKIAVASSLLAGLVWMFFFFSTQPGVKKMFFTLGVIISITCFIGLGVASQQYIKTKNTVYAIVFSDEVSVKNAPRNSALEIFSLHQGTKLKVLDKVGNWHKVKIADGQVGWIPKESIKAF
ncbi:tetratricopeptide (TPR) repeat protein [Wenyingzhuangia heitensis]|uniref:Tetratricopeptide (TPR) repeat protein n=1 Tax=Wenyingzhuangia heitensis TaxID=1487859 RepID=A0ABX0U4N6_9FLAO|nr:tetratricopeptide repeat protein [Wenyingzhuangia heitensis]NIJ43828.1 tetratricopeptide (TPR) repeat protein [Wenyingzhuangia heitensis]